MKKRQEQVQSKRGLCHHCKPDSRFLLLNRAQVNELETDSDRVFSLKVYMAAFTIAMAEFEVEVSDASLLLQLCSEHIACGHEIQVG